MAEQFDDGEQYENAPATLESLVQYEDPVWGKCAGRLGSYFPIPIPG